MNSITLTLHRANNYGAVLQAFAFQQKLLSLGIEDKIIDEPVRTKAIFSKITIEHGIKQAVKAAIANTVYLIKWKSIFQHNSLFVSFVNDNLQLTDKFYRTDDEIQKDYPMADIYFTGSDQTFSIHSPLRNSRFLRFAPCSAIKASYATSMMDYPIDRNDKDWIKESLTNYDFLSVREKKLADYINKEYGIATAVHLDPVFLLNNSQWADFAVTPQIPVEGKYILFYPIVNSPKLPAILKTIKEKLGLPVVSVQSPARRKTKHVDYYITTAKVPEFLGLFQDAEHIVTSSFHGTAFSIIFKKNFTVFTGFEKADRITNLLSKLDITSKGTDNGEIVDLSPIDYGRVEKVIEIEKERSTSYLQSIIGAAKR